MKSEGGDTFLVAFQGELVECFSLEDANAFKAAAEILDSTTIDGSSVAELSRLSVTLRSYGLRDAANQLAHLAARVRAMKFLAPAVALTAGVALSQAMNFAVAA
jgi:hypothetical protein